MTKPDQQHTDKVSLFLQQLTEAHIDPSSLAHIERFLKKLPAEEVKRSVDHNLGEQIERELLHNAAQNGDLDQVNELIRQQHPVNAFDDLGHTPLHYAVEAGHLHVVDRLIESGADVNAHDERVIGNTPLADNAKEISYEMARRLIDAGADPTIRGWMQVNALDRASERMDGDAERVKPLLRKAAERLQK